MARKFFLSILGLFLIFLVSFIIYYKYFLSSHQTTANSLTTVTTFEVKPVPITDSIESIGRALANESVTITAKVSELVTKINFQDGSTARKGDVLVELDNQKAYARYLELNAIYNEAVLQYGRFKQLVSRRAASAAQLDNQQQLMETARARLLAAKSSLDDHIIVAPFDGILGFRDISVGTLVQPGMAITTIDEIKTIKVNFTAPERDFAQLKPEMEIVAHITAYPQQLFYGRITSINPRIDPISRSVQLRGIINNGNLLIRPGMLLSLDINVNKYNALVIPTRAIITIKNDKYVYKLMQDNTVRRVKIQAGKILDGRIIVTEGLQGGDIIIDKGAFKLSPNEKVNIVKENAP